MGGVVEASLARGRALLARTTPKRRYRSILMMPLLWGTPSAIVRSDQAALRDYFVTAFKVLPDLKVTFGDQLIASTVVRQSTPATTH
jgi:hypothetical protein